MKFIIEHIFLIGIVVLSGGALLWPTLTQRGKRATALEVTQLINRGKSLIVDVRNEAEYANGHLRDARHIPLTELVQRVGELDKAKNKTIVVVCQKGVRSGLAAKVLAKAGFEDVVCLEGGVTAWQAAGLPLAK
ncbi:rhodanese-like domain-containing protein [Janthinobacterium fluminis]|uniref:Rhodanese-like domain-containing protein n=1 Tax=Janthinobacterium fluminis TaxID=2987524 RepID=A0ABT5K636_9BURK|nr:rhodanese-like domain-containing protein [Janthinobacterium fluminis]MDC8760471.1 rhodanese-like domain-containing protein [Janthinobacterium fluminis]